MKLPHLDWVNQDSPYLRQHQRGFRGLSFDDELEQAFKRYHANVFLRRMRWALLVATLLALLFVLLDAINLPDPLRGQILTLRLGVIQPLLLLAWVATYRRGLRDHLQLIGGTVALFCGLAVAGIIGLARYHNFALPYEGIILVTVFFYFLTGLRFITAMLCGWLTFVAYLVVELSIGLAGELLLSNALFLALANIIGSVGCYSLEYATRQNFLAHAPGASFPSDHASGMFAMAFARSSPERKVSSPREPRLSRKDARRTHADRATSCTCSLRRSRRTKNALLPTLFVPTKA